jgi:hypothetical protein
LKHFGGVWHVVKGVKTHNSIHGLIREVYVPAIKDHELGLRLFTGHGLAAVKLLADGQRGRRHVQSNRAAAELGKKSRCPASAGPKLKH